MKDISFDAKPGTLTMIVGSVASGKTSLLSALIGQMERLQGTVAVGGRVAYVAQTAWIINDSVQVRSWSAVPLFIVDHASVQGFCMIIGLAPSNPGVEQTSVAVALSVGVLTFIPAVCCCCVGEHLDG